MFYSSAKSYPELKNVPEELRIPVTLQCHRSYAHSKWNRVCESVFSVLMLLVVVGCFTIGLIEADFWFTLRVLIVGVFSTAAMFGVVCQFVIRRRLRSYVMSGDCQRLLRTLGQETCSG